MFCGRVCQILLSASLVVPAISAGQAAGTGSQMITGTIAYQVRMALAPEAAIDVRLEDVSVADAPAKVVAENIFSALGQQVPIPFQLPYSPQDIQPSHRYAVRARITLGENLLFTTTQTYPVLTNGAPSQVALVVEPAGAQPAAPAAGTSPATPSPAAPNGLRGTRWMLIELNGKPVVSMNPKNPAYLMLATDQKRYSGSSGCNQITRNLPAQWRFTGTSGRRDDVDGMPRSDHEAGEGVQPDPDRYRLLPDRRKHPRVAGEEKSGC